MPLTNSRGLGKIVFFSGLKFPIVITPSLMGEPIITSQAFYFMERLDSAAKMRFECRAAAVDELTRDCSAMLPEHMIVK